MTEQTTPFSRAINAEIMRLRGGAKRGRPTQEEMATAIGRTQPYVSERLAGLYPWTTADLDGLAPLFDLSVFELIANARRHMDVGASDDDYEFTATPPLPSDVELAAKPGERKIDKD